MDPLVPISAEEDRSADLLPASAGFEMTAIGFDVDVQLAGVELLQPV